MEESKDFGDEEESEEPNDSAMIDGDQSPETMEQCHSNNSAMSNSSSRRKCFQPQRQVANNSVQQSEGNGIPAKDCKFLLFYGLNIRVQSKKLYTCMHKFK